MDREQQQKLYVVLRDAYLYFCDTNNWFLPTSIREKLIAASLQPDMVERFYRYGGNYEQLLSALKGVDTHA